MLDKGIVTLILSGGQDSTTCLYWALHNPDIHTIHLVTFHYGQRHEREVESAVTIGAYSTMKYKDKIATHAILNISDLLHSSSPLTSSTPLGQYTSIEDLPGGIEPTFVPLRNTLFIVLASSLAIKNNSGTLILGVSQEDFGGYPDCRETFIKSIETTINLSLGERQLQILTPLMFLSKKETVELAMTLPGCIDALRLSHTCYAGTYPPCGKCHACHLRAKGFKEAGILDPILEA